MSGNKIIKRWYKKFIFIILRIVCQHFILKVDFPSLLFAWKCSKSVHIRLLYWLLAWKEIFLSFCFETFPRKHNGLGLGFSFSSVILLFQNFQFGLSWVFVSKKWIWAGSLIRWTLFPQWIVFHNSVRINLNPNP